MRLPETAQDELRHGTSVVPTDELERIAARVHRLAGSVSAEDMAAVLDVPIVECPRLPSGVDGALTPLDEIELRPRLTGKKRRLVILHELAHLLLGMLVSIHTHRDVWALTIMLASPGPLFASILRAANDDASMARAIARLGVSGET